MSKLLTVALGARTYPITIGEGTLDGLADCIARLAGKGKAGLITDSNAGPLYTERVEALIRAAGRECVTHTLPAGEQHKRLGRIEVVDIKRGLQNALWLHCIHHVPLFNPSVAS